ncbi:hypothetical protein [Paraflavitalea speifideaquila]|uniref:hypothetical protein n=1 Tax=Paraflavitalea speifideaquila TaxID=3076558 RepID=UPI0028E58F19|nr:hypothetical protein [Paraflavitalea speifideiaquila]
MKFNRPLQDKELAILYQQLAQLQKRAKKDTRVLVIWTLLALVIGAIVFPGMKTQAEILLLLGTVAACIGIGVWVTLEGRLKLNKERNSIGFLKQKNIVTVVEVSSDRYYELEEQEDEGVHYLFQLDNNKVFSFGGQDFYPDKQFPSDKFEIVEGRGIKNEVLLLEVFNYGTKIEPSKIITGQTKWDLLGLSDYPDPDRLTVKEGTIEEFLQK